MKVAELVKKLNTGLLDGCLISLYGADDLSFQKERYIRVCKKFEEIFGNNHDVVFFSSPGRCEIIGNHTDHNKGKVIAASIDRDNIALAARDSGEKIQICSTKNNRISTTVNAPKREFCTSSSYVEGVARGFINNGYNAGGFLAVTDSNLSFGMGLSASASFEILIGKILSYFYNEDRVSNLSLSVIGRFAETEYCKKPCGLMDQLACSNGGMISIDFKESEPGVEPIDFSFNDFGYKAFIINSDSSHSELTRYYSEITREMALVSALLGVDFLRRSNKDTVISNMEKLRKLAGDRAVLRALHYFDENERVEEAKKAMKSENIDKLLSLIDLSGRSSVTALQNIFVFDNVKSQAISCVLTLLQTFFANKKGACRIHGGGFGGSVFIVIKEEYCAELTKLLKTAFPKSEYINFKIRKTGVCTVGL